MPAKVRMEPKTWNSTICNEIKNLLTLQNLPLMLLVGLALAMKAPNLLVKTATWSYLSP